MAQEADGIPNHGGAGVVAGIRNRTNPGNEVLQKNWLAGSVHEQSGILPELELERQSRCCTGPVLRPEADEHLHRGTGVHAAVRAVPEESERYPAVYRCIADPGGVGGHRL